MSVYKPNVIQTLFKQLNIKPSKKRSQNFLIDQNIIAKIIKAASLTSDDLVLEIGGGLGALTQALLNEEAHVITIEKDKKLSLFLKSWNHPHLQVWDQDVLNIDLKRSLSSLLSPGQKAQVPANIPYHVTGILLQRLLPLSSCISRLILMLQRECAQRCVAKIGTKHYSSFSLFCQYYAHPRLLFSVKPTSFFPKPQVFSQVMQFDLIQREPSEQILSFIRQAFSKRRKMLRSSLRPLFSSQQITHALSQLKIPSTARPQELSFCDFVNLNQFLEKNN